MKELTIEQKAKAYDMALDKIERLLDIGDNCSRKELEHIFPELKKSEDERIRKALTDYFVRRKSAGDIDETWCGIPYDTIIAWLEKQGEHANFRNKIQVGDKVTRNEDGVLVNLSQLNRVAKKHSENNMGISEATKNKLEDNLNRALEKETPESWNKFLDEQGEQKFKVEKDKWYVCTSQYCNCIEGRNYKASLDGRIIDDYGTEYDMHDDAYRWFRPWTIQDAKDGDVLSYRDGQWIFIYKEKIDDSSFYYHVLYSTIHQDLTINDAGFTLLGDAIIPATKKQRDQLEKAMADAGYEWDAEKKELKKIEQKPTDNIKPKFKVKYAGNEYNVLEVKDIAGVTFYGIEDEPNHIDYVQAENCEKVGGYGIKENGSPYPTKPAKFSEQKPAWSEEDEDTLNTIINHFKIDIECTDEDDIIKWLKSLKDRALPQPKKEWSEEDIETISRVISIVKWAAYSDHSHPILNDEGATELVEWLKSLKERYTWKPSDEQLKLLKKVIDAGYYTSYPYALETLYEQLRQF